MQSFTVQLRQNCSVSLKEYYYYVELSIELLNTNALEQILTDDDPSSPLLKSNSSGSEKQPILKFSYKI